MDGVDLVTGAFGNAGSAIAAQLGEQGRAVRTLTTRSPEGGEPTDIEVRPLDWDDATALKDAFDGVETFYNTYWMRLGDRHGSYDLAVQRCFQLIEAAESAGVERILHVSIAHASHRSAYPYFRAKAKVEERLELSDVPTLVVRPTLLFGGQSVLLNNLAWALRKLPVFAVAGRGDYRVRPIHVDDLARLCVLGPHLDDEPEVHVDRLIDASPHLVVDAVGPDRPTYMDLVREIRHATGSRVLIVRTPTPAVLAGSRLIGALVRDQVLDRDELVSTVKGLADTEGPPTGSTSLLGWIRDHAGDLGHHYHNERTSRPVPAGEST